MKTRQICLGLCLAFCWLLLAGAGAQTASSPPVERVLKKEGKMLVAQNGQNTEMKEGILLPDDIKVMTNGTFRVQGGKVRTLEEGQSISSDGWLASPDGSLMPVADHVLMKNGHAVLVKDGESSALTQAMTLGNQTRIEPDGMVRTPDGRSLRLLDGQMYKLDGSPVPTKDTISLKNGKVMVQKDGSAFDVPSGRSLMMNDGTKVFGDGKVIMKDGSRVTLAEGQIIVVTGVVTLR
jgi:hypothetical protein